METTGFIYLLLLLFFCPNNICFNQPTEPLFRRTPGSRNISFNAIVKLIMRDLSPLLIDLFKTGHSYSRYFRFAFFSKVEFFWLYQNSLYIFLKSHSNCSACAIDFELLCNLKKASTSGK